MLYLLAHVFHNRQTIVIRICSCVFTVFTYRKSANAHFPLLLLRIASSIHFDRRWRHTAPPLFQLRSWRRTALQEKLKKALASAARCGSSSRSSSCKQTITLRYVFCLSSAFLGGGERRKTTFAQVSTAKRKCVKESSDQLRLSCCFVYFLLPLQLQVSRASKANVSLSLLQNSCVRAHTHTRSRDEVRSGSLSFSLCRESTVCRSFGLLLEIQRQCCIHTHTHAHIYNIHMNSAQKEKCKKKTHTGRLENRLCVVR